MNRNQKISALIDSFLTVFLVVGLWVPSFATFYVAVNVIMIIVLGLLLLTFSSKKNKKELPELDLDNSFPWVVWNCSSEVVTLVGLCLLGHPVLAAVRLVFWLTYESVKARAREEKERTLR